MGLGTVAQKPRFGFYRNWHDGWHWSLHLGPLWIKGDS